MFEPNHVHCRLIASVVLITGLGVSGCRQELGLSTWPGAGLTLVEAGSPRATIVVAAEASEKAKLAAEELQHYVKKISGATLPIQTDEKGATGTLVLVGRSKQTEDATIMIPSGVTHGRREEGFVIGRFGRGYTAEKGGKCLFFRGLRYS